MEKYQTHTRFSSQGAVGRIAIAEIPTRRGERLASEATAMQQMSDALHATQALLTKIETNLQ